MGLLSVEVFCLVFLFFFFFVLSAGNNEEEFYRDNVV